MLLLEKPAHGENDTTCQVGSGHTKAQIKERTAQQRTLRKRRDDLVMRQEPSTMPQRGRMIWRIRCLDEPRVAPNSMPNVIQGTAHDCHQQCTQTLE